MKASLFEPPPARFALRTAVRLRADQTPGVIAVVQHHCGGSRYALRLNGRRRLSDFLPESAIEPAEAPHGR